MLRTDKFHCEWTRLLLCLAVLTAGVCCQEKSQVFTIAEEEPIGTVIGQVGEPFPDVRPPFWLFADDPSIEEDLDVTLDGLIKVKSKIDREKRGQYEFVMVTEIGQNIRVIITVEDTNDNSPTFPESVINITILESAPRDAKFFIGSASDPDLGEFSTRGYDIVAGNTGNAFRLLSKRASNGVLLLDLAINGHLDYEVTSSYSLTIEAYDGGDPPRIGVMTVNVVIVDANDNSPVFNFTRYHAQVRENATVGTKVLQVFATDVDSGENGKIRYQIDRQRSDPNGNFDINSESGTIVINKELDYEDIKAYELIVVARDNGTQKLQTTAIVSVQVLNINDNAPTISLIFLTDDGTGRISETAHSGDPIARISVTDADDEDRQPVVNVTLGGGEGYFGLTTRDNIVYLIILSKPLDREIKPYYELTVVASDMGTPPLVSTETLTLYVTDTNDNAPRFSQSTYYADIQEIIAPGSSVIQLEAIDEDYGNNSMITYELLRTPGSHWEWFQINNRTGLVTTRSPVDCEMSSEPRLQVVATDSGTPPLSTTVTVIIHITDVNDNQPVFDQSFYNVSIREDAALGSCILQVGFAFFFFFTICLASFAIVPGLNV
ncbi:hypothetical protein CAPTEDRAFT_135638 [Capitella teleta]|uniref:Cadherin domain-containing protein n=1 Tax=Capitella teleta TaxID=283909 RepID=R7U4U5_CAPTE|nr:hypothetical protein CAPTEDRAFT_135638 [Capitella teleta]|eukprot:ELU01385.1 hypothetical protein CAPTEDRAFT_135638 [Capitella teleta]